MSVGRPGALAVVGHRAERDPAFERLLADRGLVVARRELDRQVEARGDPVDGRLWERVGQGLDERLATGAVAQAHPAQVAVEVARRQEVGECQLLDPGGAPIGQELLVAHRLEQRDGTTSQPSRSAGASVLLAEPA